MPLSKRYVAVGDSAEVGIGLRVSGKPRTLRKAPSVLTSDPENSTITIRLEAEIVSGFDSTTPVTIFPQRIFFAREDRDSEHWLAVRNVSDEPVTFQIISQQPGVLDIELPEGGVAPGEEEMIAVRVARDFETATHKTSFTLETSDAMTTRFTIPVEIGTAGRQIVQGAKPSAPKQPAAAAPSSRQVIRPTAGHDDKSGSK